MTSFDTIGNPTQPSITDALDDALAQLQAVTGQTIPPPGPVEANQDLPTNGGEDSVTSALDDALSAAHQAATLSLIDAMCKAADRAAAVEAIARSICPPGTRGSVRIGIGKSRLKRLYDNRLGWIGTDVSMFDHYDDDWVMHEEASRTGDLNVESSDPSTDPVLPRSPLSPSIPLTQAGRSGRCRIWVEEDPAAIRWIESSKDTIASVFWSRPQRATPNLLRKFGKRSKTWIAAGTLLIAGLMLIPVPYGIACEAKVETVSQRYVAAPFEATLLQVHVRPGDQVVKDQVLVQLDGRPLRLEHESLASDLQRIIKEHNVALATREISEAQKLALKQKTLRRKMQLIEDRLDNLQVTSPMEGVVVSGDLQRFIGSPLDRGQTLVEVAPMDRMAIEFEIPEHEIGYTKRHMDVRVRLDALGSGAIDTTMAEIYPAAEIREDRSVFVGRIELDNTDGELRPGMQGQATAYGPMRPWVWSRTRGAIERTIWWCGF